MIPEAITNPPVQWYGHVSAGLPREDQFTGPFTFPLEGHDRLHMVWSDSPCWETCWNGGNAMQDALRHESIECIVVQHPWMENDCYFADIILPTNTKFETADIGTDNDSGQWNLIFERQAIKPAGESKSDKEAVGEVARALEKFGGAYENLFNRYLGGKTRRRVDPGGFENSGAAKKMTFDEFKEKQYYPFPTIDDWEDIPAGLRVLRRSRGPSAARRRASSSTIRPRLPPCSPMTKSPRFRTGSTKVLAIRSASISPRGRKYPFLLVSNHPRWRVHAHLDDVTWFREMETCKVTGPDGYKYEPIWVNPIDAGKLGLETGDIAKIYNERGAVLGGVVTERIMPASCTRTTARASIRRCSGAAASTAAARTTSSRLYPRPRPSMRSAR